MAGLLLGTGLAGAQAPGAADEDSKVQVDDATRAAVRVSRYDMEVHLRPADGHVEAVARLVLVNRGEVPLTRVALQVSSTLQWEGVSGGSAVGKLAFVQHRIETDLDHTGAVNEAVIPLPGAVAPGATVGLTVLYGGTIGQAAVPLERAGVPAAEAARVDWDAVRPGMTGLRGVGEVVWTPVSAPQVFLGDGAKLARAVGEQMRADAGATARLRLLVETGAGEAVPATAFFCGREVPLAAVNEGGARGSEGDAAAAVRESTGVVGEGPVGFGPVSLFVVNQAPEGGTVAVAGGSAAAKKAVEAAAEGVKPLVVSWLGGSAERQPVLLDLAGMVAGEASSSSSSSGEATGAGATGQPFATGALLAEEAAEAANPFAMAHLLSHGWFRARGVWLDEGMAQLLPLLAIERDAGRAAEEARVRDLEPALQLAEAGGDGEALVEASREVMYRNKAVLVLSMLRGMVGDEALKAGLRAVRSEGAGPAGEAGVVAEAKTFEAAVEGASKRELGWFFADWVMADHGLPDLTIVHAAARPMEGREGRLVAVEVRNDGGAGAEVPVTVRSGDLTATERLVVPAKGTAAVRIVFQGVPAEVVVNDGSVPEVGQSTHVQALE